MAEHPVEAQTKIVRTIMEAADKVKIL